MPTQQELVALFGEDFNEVLLGLQQLPPEVRELLENTMGKMIYDADVFANRINKTAQTQAAAGIAGTATQGMLATDMLTGGRVFGELRNSIKESLVEGINQSGQAGSFQAYDPDEETLFVWVTVAGHKICADCAPRGGEQRKLREWENEGMPGTGWSVCGGHCYCILDPSGKISPRIKMEERERGLKIQEKGATIRQKWGPAKTTKEAETWAIGNIIGVKKANYGNMPIHRINRINEELYILQNKYGRLGNIDEIKVVKTNKFSGKMEFGHRLLINSKATNAQFMREVTSSISRGKPHLGGLIDHEIGHALTPAIYEFEKSASGQWIRHETGFGKRLKIFYNKNQNRIANDISEYAGSAMHEFVAEAFAIRESGNAPSWVIKWLESEGI